MGILEVVKGWLGKPIAAVGVAHEWREDKEDSLANIIEKVKSNEAYQKAKQENADKLVGLGFDACKAFALSQGIVIPIPQEIEEQAEDKGGDILCEATSNASGWFIKQLRKK